MVGVHEYASDMRGDRLPAFGSRTGTVTPFDVLITVLM